MTSEDGTHNGFRNVFGKFTSHTTQKAQSKKKCNYIKKYLSSKCKMLVGNRTLQMYVRTYICMYLCIVYIKGKIKFALEHHEGPEEE